MAFTFANNVSTTLASALSDSATTVVLTSAANLPTIPGGDYFAVTLNDAATQSVFEIVYVTAISGANLTVLRGQEGTAARAWLVGDFAFAADTDGILANFLQALSVAAPLSYTDGVLGIATPLAKAYGGTGTATPALVEGAGIDLTGTWPNETIANAGVLSINEETGAVEITGSGGAIVTQPSAGEVNVNTSGLVKTIASVGETVTVARTGQAVNLEVPPVTGIPVCYTPSGVAVEGLKMVYGTLTVEISGGTGNASITFSGDAIFSSSSSYSSVASVQTNNVGSGCAVTRVTQASNEITVACVQIAGSPASGSLVCAFMCIGY